MGSNNVITIDGAGNRTNPQPIPVGEGPTGILLDEVRNQAYVLNKFDASISILDLATDQEMAKVDFFDPTPDVIKTGRKHLYNTHLGSGNGHIACASCHVDGKWDRLGWDLGNPCGRYGYRQRGCISSIEGAESDSIPHRHHWKRRWLAALAGRQIGLHRFCRCV